MSDAAADNKSDKASTAAPPTQTRKRSVSEAVSESFRKSLSRVPSFKLPKLGAPKVKVPKVNFTLNRKKKKKVPSEAATVPRTAAPEVSPDLAKLINSGEFILWIGESLSNSVAKEEITTAKSVLPKLVEDLPEEERAAVLETIEKNASDGVKVLVEKLGLPKFNKAMAALLKVQPEAVAFPMEILGMLKPKAVVSTASDLYFESVNKGLGFEVVTPSSLEKFGVDIEDIKVAGKEPFLFKLNGTNSDPTTLPLISGEAADSTATTDLLKSILTTYPVVYIGADLSAESLVVELLKEINSKENEETKPGYALVPGKIEGVEAADIKAEYIEFASDDKATQIWEFAAKLAAVVTELDITEKEMPFTFKAYTKAEQIEFVKTESKAYGASSAVYYASDLLPNEFLPDNSTRREALPAALEAQYSKGEVATFMEELDTKYKSINTRLFDEADTGIVRLLLTREPLSKLTEESLAEYENLLEMAKKSNNKLQFKFAKHTEFFTLYFVPGTQTQPESKLAVSKKINTDKFVLSTINLNKAQVEADISKFENLWNSAKPGYAYLEKKINQYKKIDVVEAPKEEAKVEIKEEPKVELKEEAKEEVKAEETPAEDEKKEEVVDDKAAKKLKAQEEKKKKAEEKKKKAEELKKQKEEKKAKLAEEKKQKAEEKKKKAEELKKQKEEKKAKLAEEKKQKSEAKEEPKVEETKTEEPKADVEAPKAEDTKVEEPKVEPEAAKTEEPKVETEEPKKEETPVEEPEKKAEVEEPKAEAKEEEKKELTKEEKKKQLAEEKKKKAEEAKKLKEEKKQKALEDKKKKAEEKKKKAEELKKQKEEKKAKLIEEKKQKAEEKKKLAEEKKKQKEGELKTKAEPKTEEAAVVAADETKAEEAPKAEETPVAAK